MKKRLCLILLLTVTLCGCGKSIYPELNSNPKVFKAGEYTDSENDNTEYMTIEYKGRTYMPYGTLGKSIHSDDIKECVGYVLQNDDTSSTSDSDDNSQRVYTLVADPNDNFLLDHIEKAGPMNQPGFWRAIDTKGIDIDIPDYIDSLEYDFWEK